ncbi:MAG: hypothetical protein M3044_03575 [Thermoproteota archaeon]|jgi:hypothetical protein|nr:hypothetical protein [Thermoproteota archaeon]
MTSEFVKYVYNSRKDLRTRYEILAMMGGFLVEGMTRLTRAFDDKEVIPKVCSAKVEVEKLLSSSVLTFNDQIISKV